MEREVQTFVFFCQLMINDATKTILIVEDNPAVLEMVQIFLEGENYKVVTATEGGSVQSVAEAAVPDLILLDMWIPILDGAEVAKLLRKNSSTKAIPIVMFSAHPNAENFAKVAGVDALLTKPFELSDLLKVIQKFTSQGA